MALLIAGLLWPTAISLAAEQSTDVSRNDIVSWLRSQDAIIRAIQCEWSATVLPVPEEQIPVLKGAIERAQHRDVVQRYQLSVGLTAYSEDEALSRSFRQLWICKGIKEYTETQSREANSPLFLSATDGLVSRLYCADKTEPYAVLSKYSATKWIDRDTPLTLTYYFMDDRLSDLVEGARDFRCATSGKGDAETIDVTITVRQPDLGLRLRFDTQHRLVGREVLIKDSAQKYFDLHRRLELVDYESHRAADGAKIWFPRRVISTICVKDDKGAELPCQRMTFTVLETKFNETIPDSQFVLAIPEGTPILGQEDEPAK